MKIIEWPTWRSTSSMFLIIRTVFTFQGLKPYFKMLSKSILDWLLSHIYLCSRCLFLGWRGLLLVCIGPCSGCLVLGEWPKGVCVEFSNSCNAWSVLWELSEVLRWIYDKNTHWMVIWFFYTYTLPGVLCIFVKIEKWRTQNQ